MDSIKKLEEIFSHFPGIGPKVAKRFVHHIQTRSPTYINDLIETIKDVNSSSTECDKCHRHFISSIDTKTCAICKNRDRDNESLMIISRDIDLETIEKSAAYNGLYFVLGGTVPILDKEPEKRIRLKPLLQYVEELTKAKQLKEIIISTNTTPDGENTSDILKSTINQLLDKMSATHVSITTLGRGLSTGAEIEYADSDTIKYALGNRK